MVPEAGKSKIKAPAGVVSGESPLPTLPSFHCLLHMAEGVRGLSGLFFTKALIPFMRAPPPRPNQLSKFPPTNAITLWVGIDLT